LATRLRQLTADLRHDLKLVIIAIAVHRGAGKVVVQHHRQLDSLFFVGLASVPVEVAYPNLTAVVVSFATFVMLVLDASVKNEAVFVLNHLIDQVVSERLRRSRQLTLGLLQIQLVFW